MDHNEWRFGVAGHPRHRLSDRPFARIKKNLVRR
jgi:hypothetical protein